MEEQTRERFQSLMEDDQSNVDIQFEIGQCYLHGWGVEQSNNEAEKWFQQAADQGHEEAMSLLESAVQSVQSTDFAEEITDENLPNFCSIAEKGDANAQFQVAQYFLVSSPNDTCRYLTMAANQGHPQACLQLAKINMENNTNPISLLKDAADSGLTEAMYLLAECYTAGEYVDVNPTEGLIWYEKAAESGSGEDKLQLAILFGLGTKVPQSFGQALSWVRQAEVAGLSDARKRYDQAMARDCAEKEAFQQQALDAIAQQEQEEKDKIERAARKKNRIRSFFAKLSDDIANLLSRIVGAIFSILGVIIKAILCIILIICAVFSQIVYAILRALSPKTYTSITEFLQSLLE